MGDPFDEIVPDNVLVEPAQGCPGSLEWIVLARCTGPVDQRVVGQKES